MQKREITRLQAVACGGDSDTNVAMPGWDVLITDRRAHAAGRVVLAMRRMQAGKRPARWRASCAHESLAAACDCPVLRACSRRAVSLCGEGHALGEMSLMMSETRTEGR